MSRRRKLAIAAAAVPAAAAAATFTIGIGVLAVIAYSDRRQGQHARPRHGWPGAPPAHPRAR